MWPKTLTLCCQLSILVLLAILVLAPATPVAARDMTMDDVARLRSVTTARISPSGQQIAYVLWIPRDPYDDEDGAAWTELHIATGKGESRPFVRGEVNVSAIAWMPDGSAVTYRAKRFEDEHTGVWTIPVDGGESYKLVEFDTDISGYEISPDGKRIAFLAKAKAPDIEEKREKKGFVAKVVEEGLRPVKIWIAPLDDESTISADDVESLEVQGSASMIRWSPDGKHLAFAIAPTPLIDDTYMERRIRVADLEGGDVVEIENAGKLEDLRWSPDGSHLAALSAADRNDPNASRLMTVPSSGGPLTDLVPGLLADVEGIAWKDSSTIVYVVDRGTASSVAEIDLDGERKATHLDFGGPIWSSLSLSEGGKILSMVAQTPKHAGELYVVGMAGSAAERWTDVNPWLEEIDFAVQESITWKARDGKDIEGILIRPAQEKKGTSYPLIHVVHGGPESHYSNGWMTRYSSPGQVGAAQGYAVLYANYRGSTGLGVEFSKASQADYAGDPSGENPGEFWDLVDGIDHLVKQGLVDRNKVGITGGSYGGFASAWGATAHSEYYAASVMFVGISDQISKFGTTEIPNEMFEVHSRRWPWKHWQWFLERSPIYYVEQAKTPILIMHGEEDTRVHTSQSMELYRYLKRIGNVPVRLVLYPGEGHGNRKAAARYDYSLRLMRWMNHYLQGEGGDPPPYELDLDTEKLGIEDEEATP